METIKLRHFCRMPLMMWLLLLIALPLFLGILVMGITEGHPGLIAIGIIILLVALVGFAFFFNYGIKITSKRVSIIYMNAFRIFRYEDICYIEIGLDEESIWGTVKTKNQQHYTFYFDEFELDPGAPFSRLWTVKVKLTDKFIAKSIAQLSTCEKVRLQHVKGSEYRMPFK